MNSVKPKSQLDKRLDGFSGGGTSYLAGEGLSLNQNVFSLNSANQGYLGGIRVSAYATVPEDSPPSDFNSGIYKIDPGDAFLGLRRATKNQMGGLYLGDGLAPTVEQDGETFTNTGHVEVRIGEGLEYVENSENPADERERRQNVLGGRAIGVEKATKEKFGTVKLGKRMALAPDGSIYPVMTSGDGIEVSDEGEISVAYDKETLTIDGNGKLAVKEGAGGEGVNIGNAVIIQEKDASYFLHEYTELEYVSGNRIVYGNQKSAIVMQGYQFESHSSPFVEYANGLSGLFPNGVPANYATIALNIGGAPYILDYYLKRTTSDGGRIYELKSSSDGGASWRYHGETSAFYSVSGMYYRWETIYAPSGSYPYGYAYASLYYFGVMADGRAQHLPIQALTGVTFRANIPFASEAEYNAAVNLTHEPNYLTAVTDTATEV